MSEAAFEHRIINGYQGDPAVYVLIKKLGEAFLFDLGSLEALSQRELLKVRSVFVSHTHMDHFIGFDRLLRVNVPHKRLIRLWGPAPFIDQVQCKLRSYTWNLIDPDQIRFHVSELHEDGHIEEALLSNSDGFSRAAGAAVSQQTLACLHQFPDSSTVSAAILDHKGTRSIAYRIQAPHRYKVDAAALGKLGLRAGAWVSELQTKLKQGLLDDIIEAGGARAWSVKELSDHLIDAEAGESLAYLTDLSFDRSNLELLETHLRKADGIISECSFLDADVQRAVDKAHLTTRQSALLAAALSAKHLHSFHISAIYGQGPQQVLDEAAECFARLQSLGSAELRAALEAELTRVAQGQG